MSSSSCVMHGGETKTPLLSFCSFFLSPGLKGEPPLGGGPIVGWVHGFCGSVWPGSLSLSSIGHRRPVKPNGHKAPHVLWGIEGDAGFPNCGKVPDVKLFFHLSIFQVSTPTYIKPKFWVSPPVRNMIVNACPLCHSKARNEKQENRTWHSMEGHVHEEVTSNVLAQFDFVVLQSSPGYHASKFPRDQTRTLSLYQVGGPGSVQP